MGRYKSVLMAKRDARQFPYHVDVPVPPEGLGTRLDVMSDWLVGTFGWNWRCHGGTAKGIHVARFMFRTQTDAAAFEEGLRCNLFGVPPI